MIKGRKINLRVIKEEDIDEMTRLRNNLAERGEYYDVQFISILREECKALEQVISKN